MMSNSESNKQVAGSHTPGPWSILLGSIVAYTPGLYGLINDGDANEEDLRRIVACVNALEHISTETLEGFNRTGIKLAATEGYAQSLEHQRDQLQQRTDRAERALIGAGWTYTEGAAEWKPPVGPSASPLLERIDQVQAERDQLVTKVADLELALFAENQKRHDVERQRDMLLAVLEKVVGAGTWYCTALEFVSEIDGEELENELKAAIAAVKGDTV